MVPGNAITWSAAFESGAAGQHELLQIPDANIVLRIRGVRPVFPSFHCHFTVTWQPRSLAVFGVHARCGAVRAEFSVCTELHVLPLADPWLWQARSPRGSCATEVSSQAMPVPCRACVFVLAVCVLYAALNACPPTRLQNQEHTSISTLLTAEAQQRKAKVRPAVFNCSCCLCKCRADGNRFKAWQAKFNCRELNCQAPIMRLFVCVWCVCLPRR